MRPFTYTRPTDAAAAVDALRASPDAMFLGGGTNIVDLMKLGVARPGALVDVSRLDLGGLTLSDGASLRIGASVRNSDLAADPGVRRLYPALSEAVLAGASGQLRNLATVGGNLLQRTRCRYFQDVTKPCNKRVPGSGCPAIDGEHHNLAVLGASPACVATHPSDMAVAMLAFDASLEVRSAEGSRTLALDDLYRLPGDRPDRDTTLDRAELVTAVLLPPPPAASCYRKVRERASFAFALASVAVALDIDGDGRLSDVRIALGAVAHRPWRARAAEAALLGEVPERAAVRRAIDAELAAASPLRDNSYKVPLVRELVVSTLASLAGPSAHPTGARG